MDTADLEDLIDGAEETDQLEFKGAMSWNLSLVKDEANPQTVLTGSGNADYR